MNLSRFVNDVLSHFGAKLIRLKPEEHVRPGNAYPLDASDNGDMDVETKKILNLLAYTKNNEVTYNAQDYPSAYHTLKIDGHTFAGQRDPALRLEGVKFDFRGATVLDLGCNQGGMLLSIADQIQAGIGVDFDYKMVNAANRIRAHNRLTNLNYYVFDLEKENLELLLNFIGAKDVDIVFLLSVCMWIKNWKSVIDCARSISGHLLFESNGSQEQQLEQEDYLRSSYASVALVRAASTDDPGQQRRRLFLCQKDMSDEDSFANESSQAYG